MLGSEVHIYSASCREKFIPEQKDPIEGVSNIVNGIG